MARWIGLGLLILGGIGLLYWQLILAEGAYLGRRVVTWLYDWSAHLYDRIKNYDPGYEQWFLGLPLSRALALFPDPLVLDVATGTGRLARTLFEQAGFHGRLIGVDLSRKMLSEAAQAVEPWKDRITLLHQDAQQLPFPDATFDAVTSLEALEFTPDPAGVLREMVRVLRPGGVLLVSNRIGQGARYMPGRTFTPEAFEELLHTLPLEMIRIQPWQEDYDLAWAVKQGIAGPTGMRRLDEILRCPHCGSPLQAETRALQCRTQTRHRFPIAGDGVVELT